MKGVNLKEVRVRMSGTVSNGNYGNLQPDVTLVFQTEGVEDLGAALEHMTAVTHEAFVDAVIELVGNFASDRRDVSDLLCELGVPVATNVEIIGEATGTDGDVMESVKTIDNITYFDPFPYEPDSPFYDGDDDE